jgi:hypothetical protein
MNSTPPFLLRALSYMRELLPQRAERIGGMNGGGDQLIQKSRSDT